MLICMTSACGQHVLQMEGEGELEHVGSNGSSRNYESLGILLIASGPQFPH